MHLVLASRSVRRAELLKSAGFTFDIIPVDVDESVGPCETPAAYVARLADLKASAATKVVAPGADPIVGADTAVVIDGCILGKPNGPAHAEEMLERLSGREHEVLTGISLFAGTRRLAAVELTRVRFIRLVRDEIRRYVQTGEPLDKAGGYAIQGLGGRFVAAIEGSYSNVVGLPIERLCQLLRELRLEPGVRG